MNYVETFSNNKSVIFTNERQLSPHTPAVSPARPPHVAASLDRRVSELPVLQQLRRLVQPAAVTGVDLQPVLGLGLDRCAWELAVVLRERGSIPPRSSSLMREKVFFTSVFLNNASAQRVGRTTDARFNNVTINRTRLGLFFFIWLLLMTISKQTDKRLLIFSHIMIKLLD